MKGFHLIREFTGSSSVPKIHVSEFSNMLQKWQKSTFTII